MFELLVFLVIMYSTIETIYDTYFYVVAGFAEHNNRVSPVQFQTMGNTEIRHQVRVQALDGRFFGGHSFAESC